MSKKDVPALQKAQDEQAQDSVFDFLYHDSRRVASFLSQFDSNGHLTGLRQGESINRGARRGYKVEMGGDVPLLGGASIGFERGPAESGGESLERTYDPFWSNAREFLDAVAVRDLLKRDISTANIGQFVLVTGSLAIADLSLLAPMWSSPLMKRNLLASAEAASNANDEESLTNRHQRRAKQKQAKASGPKAPSDNEIGMEMIKHMPHSGQMSIITEEFAVWANVNEEALVTSMTELVLKHGTKVAGQWSMLGILDAKPDSEASMLSVTEMLHLGMFVDGSLVNIAHTLGPHIREALGRPMFSYGVTPLLVFREIGG